MNFKIYNNIGVLAEVTSAIKSISSNELNVFSGRSFDPLVKRTISLVQDYISLPTKEVKVDYGWIVNVHPGEEGQLHNHPTYPLVAVYYVSAAPGCGDLVLHDDRHTRIIPTPDSLIVFPGSLYHHIDPNKSAQTRTSVGMNLVFK